MQVSRILNNYQQFNGYVNIIGHEKEAKMIDTADIISVGAGSEPTYDNRTLLTKAIWFTDKDGNRQLITSKKDQSPIDGCYTEEKLYEKFSKQVSKICKKADETGKVLDIVL